MWKNFGRQMRVLSLSLAGVLVAAPALAEEQPFKTLVVAPLPGSPAGVLDLREISSDDAEEVVRSEYWVGVQLSDLPDLVKAQLNLDYGLATIAVMPDSPALKAGLEQHDILLKVGDKQLREPIELVRAVNEAKDRKIKLTFLRHGKEQVIEVQSDKRPKPAADENQVKRVFALQDHGAAGGPELAALERALRALEQSGQSDERLGMWFVRPPILSPHTVQVAVQAFELPDDVSVQVNKKGSAPATATVKRGNESWQVTADKLDTLPEDLRAPVGQMLGKGHAIAVRAEMLHGTTGVSGATPAAPGDPVRTRLMVKPGAPGTKVERREVIISEGNHDLPNPGIRVKDDLSLHHKLDLILQKLDRLNADKK